MYCLAIIDVLFVDEQVSLATTALMPNVMAVMNLAILHWTVPTRFLNQEHHATKTDLIQGINIPTAKGTHVHSYYGPRHSNRSQSTAVPTATEAAVLEGTSSTPFPATTSAHAALQPIGFSHQPSHHDICRHSDTPSSTCHFSYISLSMDQNQSCSSNSHHTAHES